jgi:hypothetical protein
MDVAIRCGRITHFHQALSATTEGVVGQVSLPSRNSRCRVRPQRGFPSAQRARGIRTRIAPIELGTINGIRISMLLETDAISNGYGFSSTLARAREALSDAATTSLLSG